MAQYQQGAPPWNRKTFFGLQLYLAKRCCENLQSARGPARSKFGPAIKWLVDVTIYCTIFQTQFSNSPPTSPVFTNKILKKKISHGKCWLNKSLNISWGGLGPLAEHVLLQLVIFMTKQKPRSSSGLLFSAKMLQETMHLTSPYLDQITYN